MHVINESIDIALFKCQFVYGYCSKYTCNTCGSTFYALGSVNDLLHYMFLISIESAQSICDIIKCLFVLFDCNSTLKSYNFVTL